MTPAADTAAFAHPVQAQAREWFVRLLDDDLSVEEISAWEVWLRAHPDHAAAFDGLTDLWSAAGDVPMGAPTTAQLREDGYTGAIPVRSWRQRRGRLKLVWAAGIGAAAAAAVCAALIVYPRPVMDSRQIVTARAETRGATLADGSSVTVGGKSRLDVTFNRRQRSLALTRGEAAFQVAHEPARPFVVHTPLGTVTAVGTAFDVDVGARTVTLTVSQGVVAVDPSVLRPASAQAGQPLRVAAGQRLLLEPQGVHLVQLRPEDMPSPSWAEGLIEYRDTPLRTVLEDVNRYAERPIVLTDAGLGDLAYTGAVQLNNTLAWAKGLEGAFPVVTDTSDGGKIAVRRKGPLPHSR